VFPAPRFLLALALLASLIPTTGHARLGETLAQLKQRYGTPAPQARRDPGSAAWFFEGEDGELAFTVTFNAKGESIAEGLKPLKRALFPQNTVQDFIDLQMAPYRGSKTLRAFQPGDKYTFAGKVFACGEQESALVDEPNGILIVWTRSGVPSVMAVRPEMIR
jgi:hypothetical protein